MKGCAGTPSVFFARGPPSAAPQRYAQASAIKLLPLGLPQVLVLGAYEEFVPLPLVDAYVKAATDAGDPVPSKILIPGAGHFDSPAHWRLRGRRLNGGRSGY